MTKRRVVTQGEVIKMGALLNAHLDLISEDPKFFKYREGWSDERIAKETSDELNWQHAARLRLNILGPLKPDSPTDDRISNLEEALALTQKQLWEMIDKYDKLIIALSVNRIHDCRHLAVKQTFTPSK